MNSWKEKNWILATIFNFLLSSSAQNKELLVINGPKEDIQINTTLILIKLEEAPQTRT